MLEYNVHILRLIFLNNYIQPQRAPVTVYVKGRDSGHDPDINVPRLQFQRALNVPGEGPGGPSRLKERDDPGMHIFRLVG